MQKRIEDLSRRELLKLFGMTVGATLGGQAAWPLKLRAQSSKVTPRKNVRNVIVIQNSGAMSPPETLDFKETKWTAKDLDIRKVNSDFYLSKTLFPNYEKWAPRATLVRSMYENGLIHFVGQYHTQTGRALNPAIVREVPAYGSIIAYELESERRESDTFPTYLSFDLWHFDCPQIGAGMLPPKFAGLDINTTTVFSSFGGGAEESAAKSSALEKRWETLGRLSEVSPAQRSPLGGKATEYQAHYQYAYRLLQDKRFRKVLDLTDEEKQRYVGNDGGQCKIGITMLLARNILAADAGARFLWVGNIYNGSNGCFDNHEWMYSRNRLPLTGDRISIYDSAPILDRALGNLVQDLSTIPGHAPGKTLLDETMIVVTHEFGRDPEMNSNQGRDHWGKCFTNMYIGGAVKPGRVIGKTDERCFKVVDNGWKYKEQPMHDHETSTIYSCLGIDYSKVIQNTPSGRAYEYQQTAPLGGPEFIPRTDIEDLFV
jgi:Protein of unknown function (DUF1501)